VGALALVLFGYSALLLDRLGDAQFLISLILFCWCLLVYTMINWFHAPPPSLESASGYWQHLTFKIRRFLLLVMAVIFICLTVALAYLSYRLLISGVG